MSAMQARKEEAHYEFTNKWFQKTADMAVWSEIIRLTDPKSILEVGCYEGNATTWLIERCQTATIVCVDTWDGGKDLPPEMMLGVEERFDKNTALALAWAKTAKVEKIKAKSSKALPTMLYHGRRFDLIYVDGSHTAPDVLADAVDCFRLLNVDGAMIFDDYVWYEGEHGQQNVLDMPKPAIDAFINLNIRKLKLVFVGEQLVLIKTSD